MNEVNKLMAKPLPSTRTGAFYNTFPYPTKISPEAIAVYIACMTKPGNMVLDTFGGSGSTAIAALLCEHPTERMREIASELGVNPTWGSRNSTIYEIGTYASFATRTLTSRLSSNEIRRAIDDFVVRAEKEVGILYEVEDCNGKKGTLRHVIWSEVLRCPKCKKEISYFEYGTRRKPVQFLKEISCPHCKNRSSVEKYLPVTIEVYDKLLKKNIFAKKREPAWIYGVTDGENWDRAATDKDKKIILDYSEKDYSPNDNPKEIEWGELHRAGYHYGITHLHHFYTRRNYDVMYRLWEMTSEYSAPIQDALKLLLLSYNATHCTLMTRVVAKKNAKDFVLTGAQSGVLYISKLPVEKNIILGLTRKAKPFIEAFRMLEKCNGAVYVNNNSSEKMNLSDESIDFVFTDPPFGDFIPYAEVNQINELWLRETTNRDKEIIISQSQNKTVDKYQEMLTSVFLEIKRVIKESGYVAVVFHAAKAKVWEAFEAAIYDSGLSVYMTNILDKKQASFKQIVSEDSVQGDPLVLLRSKRMEVIDAMQDKKIIEEILAKNYATKIDERRIYSQYVNLCLERGQIVTLDAKDVYAYIRNHDGRKSNE